jgi:sterol 3beta-glucosyltransferase
MVNRWRKETLGLPALPLSASELELRGDPVVRLYPCSPRVVPVPALEDGPPPVYVGFGSAAPDPEGSRAAALAALRRLGLRGVLVTGRSVMASPEVVEIEGAPHDRLFPRMAAVVHHGGAGTTAEGLRAGRPTAVFPSNFGDQLFWGRRVHALGVGPEPVPQKRLTAEGMVAAIHSITDDEDMRRRAAALGEKIQAEDGVARAVEIVAGRTAEESSGP